MVVANLQQCTWQWRGVAARAGCHKTVILECCDSIRLHRRASHGKFSHVHARDHPRQL